MAGEFTRHRVSELIACGALALGDGYRAKNSELGDKGLPFARAGNINGEFLFNDVDRVDLTKISVPNDKISRPHDTVFTSKGTVGRFARVKDDTPQFVYSPQLCYWRSLDTNMIDEGYLYYWLLGPEFYSQYKGVSGQTDMAEYVSLGDQRSMWITLPDLSHQRAVARVLGSLDDRIELNRRTAATLEAMARALFKSWFVDFEPVHAKAEGRSTGLPTEIAALFPDRFGEDGLPATWSGTADDLGRNVREQVKPGDLDPNTSYVGLEHLDKRNLTLTRMGKAEEVDSQKAVFKRGDLLFGKLRPYFHKVAVAPLNGICSTDIFVFRPQNGIPPTYLYLAFSTDEFVAKASRAQEGTRMPRADWGFMRKLVMAKPEPQLLTAFDNTVSPLFEQLLVMSTQSQLLASVRDTLLPKLISGELRIKNAETGGIAA
ncbi:restriction endonuclease subunit S [Agrobacterium pusense]|uniref:restriction endonuclease subunit S n=1 Tax=Agrobacterium pusense TaxID=648995 RepID=UPI001AECFF58|nr:restriction endonuclease subunit S [Agrobacterium pusense]